MLPDGRSWDERRDEANKKKRAEVQVAAQKLIRASKLPMKAKIQAANTLGAMFGNSTVRAV